MSVEYVALVVCHILCTAINVIYYCGALIYSKCNLPAPRQKTKKCFPIFFCFASFSVFVYNPAHVLYIYVSFFFKSVRELVDVVGGTPGVCGPLTNMP